MSHYAKLVEPLKALFVSKNGYLSNSREELLPVGTSVKCVKVVNGGFQFVALISDRWLAVWTDWDLPSFTDKGRAHRAKSPYATITRGRPPRGSAPFVVGIRIPMTRKQREWIRDRAKRENITAAEYARHALIVLGMPG